MQSFTTTDKVLIKYLDTALLPTSTAEDLKKPWLILIHGFTGTSLVYQHNVPTLSLTYRVIAPDLRGHGESGKPIVGGGTEISVVRLAGDLRELMGVLAGGEDLLDSGEWRCGVMGGSLGCAIIWSYAHLHPTTPFTHTILIDQSPLQALIPGDWEPPYCHKGLQTPSDLASFQSLVVQNPSEAHLGTVQSCLGYLSHPIVPSSLSPELRKTENSEEKESARYEADKQFFIGQALKGDGAFYSVLMTNHTTLDHRANIKKSFGVGSRSVTKVLVVASSRSGCFEPEGVLKVVELVNGEGGKGGKDLARGVVVEWGGHWCYWEDPERFNELALGFLAE